MSTRECVASHWLLLIGCPDLQEQGSGSSEEDKTGSYSPKRFCASGLSSSHCNWQTSVLHCSTGTQTKIINTHIVALVVNSCIIAIYEQIMSVVDKLPSMYWLRLNWLAWHCDKM